MTQATKQQQQYFNKCLSEASKSPMAFKLGAVLVKGGKVLSTGFNHTRTGYTGPSEGNKNRGFITPASFHAEMHAVFTATGGISPSFKAQTQFFGRGLNNQQMDGKRNKAKGNQRPMNRVAVGGRSRLGGASASSSHAAISSSSSSDEDDAVSCPDHHVLPTGDVDVLPAPPQKGSRRRHSRVNGSDIYVVRILKEGTGRAYPCTRCIEWCRWAGVKRIYHWDPDLQAFLVVKVNDSEAGYQTPATMKMYDGTFV